MSYGYCIPALLTFAHCPGHRWWWFKWCHGTILIISTRTRVSQSWEINYPAASCLRFGWPWIHSYCCATESVLSDRWVGTGLLSWPQIIIPFQRTMNVFQIKCRQVRVQSIGSNMVGNPSLGCAHWSGLIGITHGHSIHPTAIGNWNNWFKWK